MPRILFFLQTGFSLWLVVAPKYVKRKNRAWALRAKKMLRQT